MSIGFTSVLLFLTWLGGVAFVLRRAADWPLVAALPVAALAGVAVAALMQVAIRKLSDPTGSVLEPEQFRLPGTIGRLSGAIRAGGTGEIVYEQGGVRHVSAARVADGRELPRGTEVIVLRVERGIATVEPFDAFASLERDAARDAPLAERRPG
jgi:membrane protein implicated in regulation of membrane protease activity